MKYVAATVLCHAGATLLAGTTHLSDPAADQAHIIGLGFCYLGALALTGLVITDLSKKPTSDDAPKG
ncbi:MAG: hypothetical protein VB877_08230 [Pirellulaceae bacterium]